MFGQVAIGYPASSIAADAVRINIPNVCNPGGFQQIPGYRDYFISRILGNGGPCPAVQHEHGGVALFQMDWGSHTLNFLRLLFPPLTDVDAGGRLAKVVNAYDPSVTSYNGELWVAFECATGTTATCVGPLNWNKGAIDPNRTTEVVLGIDADRKSGFGYSASIPEILVFRGRIYLYWAAIKARNSDHVWEDVTIRGMELQQERSGLRRMWGVRSGGRPVASHDPARNLEVVSLDRADPYSNQSLDLKGVYADQNFVYVIVARGGRGPSGTETCVNPHGTSYGCFRLQILRSSQPLGTDVFDQHPLVAPSLPLNPAAYQRPFIAPDGTLNILGTFLNPPRETESMLSFPSKTGNFTVSYRLPLARLQFK